MEAERPAYFSGVPAIYFILTVLPDDVRPDASSLRLGVCGAAPMPADAIVRQPHRRPSPRDRRAAVPRGRPRRRRRRRLTGAARDRRRDRGPGPHVMRGYLGRPTETGDALRGGWLHTGDVGHLDTDGYLVIVDRKKDLILRGGENISPSEVPRAIHEIDELPRNAVGKVTKDVLRQRVAAPR